MSEVQKSFETKALGSGSCFPVLGLDRSLCVILYQGVFLWNLQCELTCMFSDWAPQCPAIQSLSPALGCRGEASPWGEAAKPAALPAVTTGINLGTCLRKPPMTASPLLLPQDLTLETPPSDDSACTRGHHSAGIEASSGGSFSTEHPKLALILIAIETLLPVKQKKQQPTPLPMRFKQGLVPHAPLSPGEVEGGHETLFGHQRKWK